MIKQSEMIKSIRSFYMAIYLFETHFIWLIVFAVAVVDDNSLFFNEMLLMCVNVVICRWCWRIECFL